MNGNPRPAIGRPLRVVAYTDAAGIGDAETNLSHLVTNVSGDIDITVIGTSGLVVDAIAESKATTTSSAGRSRRLKGCR